MAVCPVCRIIHEAVGRGALKGADDERTYRITHCRLCYTPSDKFQALPDQPDLAEDEMGYPMAVVPWLGVEDAYQAEDSAAHVAQGASSERQRALPMEALDIRLHGRRWTAGEMSRRDDLPRHLEVVRGKLGINDEQRMLLLGALLEHIGTARAVSLGPLQAWQAAIEKRQRNEKKGAQT